eukprot:3129856-Pleurochrysis_carterae.AAC.1
MSPPYQFRTSTNQLVLILCCHGGCLCVSASIRSDCTWHAEVILDASADELAVQHKFGYIMVLLIKHVVRV